MSKLSAFSALFTILTIGWPGQAQAATPPSGFTYCGSQGDQSCCYHVVPTWWCPSDKRIESGTCSVTTQRFGALSGTLYKCLEPSKAGSPAKGGKIIPRENAATVARSKAALKSPPPPAAKTNGGAVIPGPSVTPTPSGSPADSNESQDCDGDESGTCHRGDIPASQPIPRVTPSPSSSPVPSPLPSISPTPRPTPTPTSAAQIGPGGRVEAKPFRTSDFSESNMCNNVGLSLNGVNKGNACCARCAEFKPHLEKGATVGDTSKYNLCLALGSIYADGRCTGISSMKIEEKYRSKGWSGSAAPEVNANCPISIPESVSAAIGGGNVVVTSTQGLHMPDQKVPWSSEYRGMIDSGKGITMEQWLFGIPRAQSGAAQAGLIRGFTNSGFCRDSGIEAPSWPPKDLPKTAVPLTGKCGTAEVSEVFGSKAFVTRAGVLFFDPLDSDTVGFMRMHGSDSVYCQVPAQDAVEFATQVDGKAGDADFDQFVGPYAPKVLKNNRTRLQSARYGCSPLPNTSQIDVTAGQSDSVLGSLRRVDGPRGFNRIFGVSARDNPSPLASVDFAPDSLGGYVFSGRCKDGSPAFRGLNNVNGIASQPGGISTGGSDGQGTAGDAGGSSATGSSRPEDRSR